MGARLGQLAMSEFNGDQTCNDAGEALIKSFESFSRTVYPDPGSPLGKACANAGLRMPDYQNIPDWQNLSGEPWTIAWGHTKGITANSSPCTDEQAEGWFRDDLEEAEFCLNNGIRYHLSSNQFSALCSLTFNIGVHNFERSSAFALINQGDMGDAPAHILLWDKDHAGNVEAGLVKRRKAEVALFETPDPAGDSTDDDSST